MGNTIVRINSGAQESEGFCLTLVVSPLKILDSYSQTLVFD